MFQGSILATLLVEDEDHLSSESVIVSSEEYGPVQAVEGDEENGQNYLAN